MAHDRFISGDPAQVVEEVQRYRELLGINDLICHVSLPVSPHDRVTRSMRLSCTHRPALQRRVRRAEEAGLGAGMRTLLPLFSAMRMGYNTAFSCMSGIPSIDFHCPGATETQRSRRATCC
jgi:hypothetical protein